MTGIDYDPTRKSLYKPGDADDFFQLLPLPSEAALCAEMARLAYVKQAERVEEYLMRVDFEPLFFLGYDIPMELSCSPAAAAI
jgi:hypothetical protein